MADFSAGGWLGDAPGCCLHAAACWGAWVWLSAPSPATGIHPWQDFCLREYKRQRLQMQGKMDAKFDSCAVLAGELKCEHLKLAWKPQEGCEELAVVQPCSLAGPSASSGLCTRWGCERGRCQCCRPCLYSCSPALPGPCGFFPVKAAEAAC